MKKLFAIFLCLFTIAQMSAPRKKGAGAGRRVAGAGAGAGAGAIAGAGAGAAYAGAIAIGVTPRKVRIRNKHILGGDSVALLKIEEVRNDPKGMLKPVADGLSGCFKLTIGDYRAILAWTRLNELKIEAYGARGGAYDMSIPKAKRDLSIRIASKRRELDLN